MPPWSPPVLATLALVLTGLVGSPAARAGDTEVLEDPGYRLELIRPAPDWDLLDERDAVSLVSSARLGATGPGASLCVVTTQPWLGGDLATWARALFAQTPLPGAEIADVGSLDYQGVPAARRHARWTSNGAEMDQETTLFVRGDVLFQVLCQAPRATVAPMRLPGLASASYYPRDQVESYFRVFHAALTLLPGDVVSRPPLAPERADRRGVGWRIRDGRYENAAYAFAVTPPAGWAFVDERERAALPIPAELALVHVATGALVVVVTERPVGFDAPAYDASVRSRFENRLEEHAQGEPLHATFLGAPLALARLPGRGPAPVEIAVGTRVSPKTCYWVVTFLPERNRADGARAVSDAIAAFQSLSAEAAAALARELAALPDPQEAVGPTTSLRAGVWRNHALGVVWKKPSPAWRVSIDPTAGPGGHFEDLASGMQIVFGVQDVVVPAWAAGPTGSDDDAWYHQQALQGLDATPVHYHARAKATELAGLPALGSIADAPVAGADGPRLLEVVVTAKHDDHHLVFRAEAPLLEVEQVQTNGQAALDGFELPADGCPAERGDAHHVEDLRLGFSFSVPPDGWVLRQETPGFLRANGTMLQALGPAQTVVVAAVADTISERLARRSIVRAITGLLDATFQGIGESAVEEATLAGLVAERHTWRVGARRFDLLLATRGATLYAVGVFSRPEGGGLGLDDLAKRFALLP